MSCDVGEAAEGLENELWSNVRAGEWGSVLGNASLCPSATTVPIQYLFPRCLPCLSWWRTHNQTSSATMDKCTDLRKYAFPDPCLLDLFFLFWCVLPTHKIFDTFLTPYKYIYFFLFIIRVFCPKAGPSLQAEKPRLQFCRRQVFHRKLRNKGCIFTRDLIGAIAFRCFPHPTLSLASEQTLKDLKRSLGHQRGGEENGFG